MYKSWLTAVAALVLVAAAGAAPPEVTVETIARPVVTSRMFSWGVAPSKTGGAVFVAQFMNYNYTNKPKHLVDLPTGQRYLAYDNLEQRPEAEWVVADLDQGTTRIFSWPGFHSAIAPTLAPNGRLFFGVDYGHVYYYDPADGAVKPVGQVTEKDRQFYKLITGPDGMIYASSQANSGTTSLLRLNPDTLEYKMIHEVGLPGRRDGLTYGYYLAVDPPWAYVAVGQGNWELFAVNMDSGEKKLLAEVQGDASRVTVSGEGHAIRAEVIAPGQPKRTLRLADGAVLEDGAPAPAPRQYEPLPLTQSKSYVGWQPPQIDAPKIVIGGKGEADVVWRPAGDNGEWRRHRFAIERAEPVRLEMLTALPDGSLLGNAYQYHGFYRLWPDTGKIDYFGKLGPSQPHEVTLDGKVYWSGYPNTTTYVYDPTKPWTLTVEGDAKNPELNPHQLGTFGQGMAETHHAHTLAAAPGRVYVLGQRERWSTGAGVGYYDVASGKLFGLGTANKEIDPRGLAVLPQAGRVIVSGALNGAASGEQIARGADLLVYDLDLKEVSRISLAKGVKDAGPVWPAAKPNQFLGLLPKAEGQADLYLYDLDAKQVVKSVTLQGGELGPVIYRASDKTFWFLQDWTLNRLDPNTLALTPVAKLTAEINDPFWVGTDLYGKHGNAVTRAKIGR